MINNFVNYIKETKVELKNTNWPSKNQTMNFTLLVIGLSVAVSIFLGAFDMLFVYLLGKFVF